MEPRDIFGFVLALLVVGNVVLAWITYELRRSIKDVASSTSTTVRALQPWRARIDQLAHEHSKKLAELESQSPLELGVKVVELSEAVERLRKTHQKFAGRISQELGTDMRPDNAPPTIDREALRREHAKDIMPAGLKR